MSGENKTLRVLQLYESLLKGEQIVRDIYCFQHNINERTFDRDIAEIRNFLGEMHASAELIYDREVKCYYLKQDFPVFIDPLCVWLAIKALDAIKPLSPDEYHGTLKTLFKACSKKDRVNLHRLLDAESAGYISDVKTARLKLFRDLNQAIIKKLQIRLIGALKTETRQEIISPLKIIVNSDGNALLKALTSDGKIQLLNLNEVEGFVICF